MDFTECCGLFLQNKRNLLNRNTGWITGIGNNAVYQIAKSTNGGLNWSLINSNLKYEPGQIYMVSENKGYIPIAAWDSIASTSDRISWNYFRAGNSTGQPVQKIIFLDSLNGWMLGYNAYTCRTTNGGNNWTFIRNNIWNTDDMFFINSQTGWIAKKQNLEINKRRRELVNAA